MKLLDGAKTAPREGAIPVLVRYCFYSSSLILTSLSQSGWVFGSSIDFFDGLLDDSLELLTGGCRKDLFHMFAEEISVEMENRANRML